MKRLIATIIFGVLLISAAALYRLKPEIFKRMVVSESADIPHFIDTSMNIPPQYTNIEKMKSLSDAGFEFFKLKLRDLEIRKEYDSVYAGHKFISNEVLGGLLKKFNLAYSGIASFTCDVPNINLKEIKAFLSKHPIVTKEERVGDGIFSIPPRDRPKLHRNPETGELFMDVTNELLIVAPSTCFTTIIGGYTVDGKQIIKDPIVLYKVESGHIIVTSW